MNVQRKQVIRALLQNQPFVSLAELEKMFPDVSSMTLRRDIEYFESTGEAIKVRGGARSMKFIHPTAETAGNRTAQCAVGMIAPGRSIFLDSGALILTLASLLPDERINVITTGPDVALELVKKNQPVVNLVGGMLNRESLSISGSYAMRFIEDINIDAAFIVPAGISLTDGMTCGNYSECELKKLVVGKARRVVMLVDSSGLDKSLPYTFCTMNDIDMIITERELPSDIADQADQAGVQIVIA